MDRIDIIPGYLFGYRNKKEHMLKADGSEFSDEELDALAKDLFDSIVDNKERTIEVTYSEPVYTYFLKSSPNANSEDGYISEEDLVHYAAMLNGLTAKHNITTKFEVKFSGIDGWMVVSEISPEDYMLLALSDSKFEEYRDDIQEYINDYWQFSEEEEA